MKTAIAIILIHLILGFKHFVGLIGKDFSPPPEPANPIFNLPDDTAKVLAFLLFSQLAAIGCGLALLIFRGSFGKPRSRSAPFFRFLVLSLLPALALIYPTTTTVMEKMMNILGPMAPYLFIVIPVTALIFSLIVYAIGSRVILRNE